MSSEEPKYIYEVQLEYEEIEELILIVADLSDTIRETKALASARSKLIRSILRPTHLSS